MERFFRIEKNVISGQSRGCFLRLQIGYVAFFIGWLPVGFSGLQWGFFAPIQTVSGYSRKGFYGQLCIGLKGAVPNWPKWYRKAFKLTSFSFDIGTVQVNS